MTKVESQVLYPPTLKVGKDLKQYSDYTRYQFKHTEPIRIDDGKILFVYSKRSEKAADKVFEDLAKAGKALIGAQQFNPIEEVVSYDKNGEGYITAIKKGV